MLNRERAHKLSEWIATGAIAVSVINLADWGRIWLGSIWLAIGLAIVVDVGLWTAMQMARRDSAAGIVVAGLALVSFLANAQHGMARWLLTSTGTETLPTMQHWAGGDRVAVLNMLVYAGTPPLIAVAFAVLSIRASRENAAEDPQAGYQPPQPSAGMIFDPARGQWVPAGAWASLPPDNVKMPTKMPPPPPPPPPPQPPAYESGFASPPFSSNGKANEKVKTAKLEKDEALERIRSGFYAGKVDSVAELARRPEIKRSPSTLTRRWGVEMQEGVPVVRD